MKPDKRPGFEDVAQIITKDDKPLAWMPLRLEFCAGFIIAARHIQDNQPTSTDTQDSAEKIERAASLLIRLFAGEDGNDASYFLFPLFLQMYGDKLYELPWEKQTALIEDLRDIVTRAQRVRKQFSGKKSGPGKAWNRPEALSARELCAAIVIEAWNIADGALPSSSNTDAWEAADSLWLASGGPRLNRNNETDASYNRWRRPMEAALKKADRPERKRIREALSRDPPAR
jgi:hypothetical protein